MVLIDIPLKLRRKTRHNKACIVCVDGARGFLEHAWRPAEDVCGEEPEEGDGW